MATKTRNQERRMRGRCRNIQILDARRLKQAGAHQGPARPSARGTSQDFLDEAFAEHGWSDEDDRPDLD